LGEKGSVALNQALEQALPFFVFLFFSFLFVFPFELSAVLASEQPVGSLL
jgi:hypothetical protein